MNRTERMFEDACSIYAEHGVDVKKALRRLDFCTIGIHAWQGDDVTGFENTGHALTGAVRSPAIIQDVPEQRRNCGGIWRKRLP